MKRRPLVAVHFAAVCLLLWCATTSWNCCCEAFVLHRCCRCHPHGIATTAYPTKRPPFLLFLRSSVKSNTAAKSLTREEQRDDHYHVIQNSKKNASTTIASLVLDELGRRRQKNDAAMMMELYAEQFDLTMAEAALYALLSAMRRVASTTGVNMWGLTGTPFVLRHAAVVEALFPSHNDGATAADTTTTTTTGWPGFFTLDHLKLAVEEDFLDAARGSTDNRKAWQITDVSVPRGESFQAARMTFADVTDALQKGTLIMNAAGAHIPRLAGLCLAACDATFLPCALNLYVTTMRRRTSAPPHTDQQDVLVVQTAGRKRWQVFAVPDPRRKPQADIFKRGKGDDALPLYSLLQSSSSADESSSSLLLDVTLHPGDVLFVPAGFPHTTSTVVDPDGNSETTNAAAEENGKNDGDNDETSVHLTMGIDHHIWDLDYVSARRLALQRAGVQTDPYSSLEAINRLSEASLRARLLAELPLGLLEGDDNDKGKNMVPRVVETLQAIAADLGDDVAAISTWCEAVERIRLQGVELLDIHRAMYLAAIEEGRVRQAEAAMTAHLAVGVASSTKDKPDMNAAIAAWTPERMQRLSVFRVKRFYDQISVAKEALQAWSVVPSIVTTSGGNSDNSAQSGSLSGNDPLTSPNWASELPVKVGDAVEADLGGAWFAATVTRAAGGTYDVAFFDGDRETNLPRAAIKLLHKPAPPTMTTSSNPNLTTKQLKKLHQKKPGK